MAAALTKGDEFAQRVLKDVLREGGFPLFQWTPALAQDEAWCITHLLVYNETGDYDAYLQAVLAKLTEIADINKMSKLL